MKNAKRIFRVNQAKTNDFSSKLSEFESKMNENPQKPLEEVIIWHVDEIDDKEDEEIHKLWKRLITLKLSKNPQALHFLYFSGVFDLKTFGSRGAGPSPSKISWIFQEPFSKDDLEKLFTSYLERIETKKKEFLKALFEQRIDQTGKNMIAILGEISFELFGGIPRPSGSFKHFLCSNQDF